MMRSCKKATELIEKRNIFPLSRAEKIQCRVHLLMCKTCTAFEKQSKAIDLGLKRMMDVDQDTEGIQLSDEMKGEIKGRIS